MYMLMNKAANRAYQIEPSWWHNPLWHVHVYADESVWMVPGTVDPLED